MGKSFGRNFRSNIKDEIFVTTTGKTSREFYELEKI